MRPSIRGAVETVRKKKGGDAPSFQKFGPLGDLRDDRLDEGDSRTSSPSSSRSPASRSRGEPIKATDAARPRHARTVTIGGFAIKRAEFIPAARRTLTALDRELASGASVRVVGHTDGSSDDTGYPRSLGHERAAAVKAFLARHGARATSTVVSHGATEPGATSVTTAGCALNRRVVPDRPLRLRGTPVALARPAAPGA